MHKSGKNANCDDLQYPFKHVPFIFHFSFFMYSRDTAVISIQIASLKCRLILEKFNCKNSDKILTKIYDAEFHVQRFLKSIRGIYGNPVTLGC